MKGLKLKLVYWLMKSMRMRFVAFEINKDETLSIQGNINSVRKTNDNVCNCYNDCIHFVFKGFT